MSISIVVDMNLSPTWVGVLEQAGIQAIHWSVIGDPTCDDTDIMSWARQNGFAVFTNDLDFGTLLATTNAIGPSVIQFRARYTLPNRNASVVIAAIHQFRNEIEKGVLIVIEPGGTRVRLLPLK